MTDTAFQCQSCGRLHRCKPHLAGRSARCACGAILTIPVNSPSADPYDLAVPASPPPQPPPAPRILAYQHSAAAAASAPDAYFPDRVKDLQLPLILLAAGILIETAARWWVSSAEGGGLLRALSECGIDLILGTTLMLIAVLIAAKRRAINLGRFWAAILKLSAISVAPSSAMVLFYVLFFRFIPFGDLINLLLGFCLFFALIGAFFDLDQSDTWYVVAVIFLMKVAVFLAARFLLPN